MSDEFRFKGRAAMLWVAIYFISAGTLYQFVNKFAPETIQTWVVASTWLAAAIIPFALFFLMNKRDPGSGYYGFNGVICVALTFIAKMIASKIASGSDVVTILTHYGAAIASVLAALLTLIAYANRKTEQMACSIKPPKKAQK